MIFDKLTQESAQSIEDSIIKSCEGLIKDIRNIYNLTKDQPYQNIDRVVFKEFFEHYEREIPLLQSIEFLLDSTKIHSCEIEGLIISQMLDYLKDRISDIKFIRNMFDKEVCFTDIREAIEDFFDSTYLKILRN